MPEPSVEAWIECDSCGEPLALSSAFDPGHDQLEAIPCHSCKTIKWRNRSEEQVSIDEDELKRLLARARRIAGFDG